MSFGSLVAVYFIISLTGHLDTGYFNSKTQSSLKTRKILLNSLYLILAFVGVNTFTTICSHRYIKIWVYSLYGIQIKLKQNEES